MYVDPCLCREKLGTKNPSFFIPRSPETVTGILASVFFALTLISFEYAMICTQQLRVIHNIFRLNLLSASDSLNWRCPFMNFERMTADHKFRYLQKFGIVEHDNQKHLKVLIFLSVAFLYVLYRSVKVSIYYRLKI
jgi:hypothetical protein